MPDLMRSEEMVASHTAKNDGNLKAPWLVYTRLSGITSRKPVVSAQTQLKQSGS